MLLCICVVSFHLHDGQKVERVYPKNCLDAKELQAVAFNAFPVRTLSLLLHFVVYYTLYFSPCHNRIGNTHQSYRIRCLSSSTPEVASVIPLFHSASLAPTLRRVHLFCIALASAGRDVMRGYNEVASSAPL